MEFFEWTNHSFVLQKQSLFFKKLCRLQNMRWRDEEICLVNAQNIDISRITFSDDSISRVL